MRQPSCECGHEKRDHRPPRHGIGVYGECKICLCDSFRKPPPPVVTGTVLEDYSTLRTGAPRRDWIIERRERKNSPQGLNVMVEELHWLGQKSITHEQLAQAVSLELKKPRPRIEAVAEGVYWFAGKCTPPGWSLFSDQRMLPCFYREYPPAVSWEQLDQPENILPQPQKMAAKR